MTVFLAGSSMLRPLRSPVVSQSRAVGNNRSLGAVAAKKRERARRLGSGFRPPLKMTADGRTAKIWRLHGFPQMSEPGLAIEFPDSAELVTMVDSRVPFLGCG